MALLVVATKARPTAARALADSGQAEIAVLEYVSRLNHRRLLGEGTDLPPGAFEEAHYRHRNSFTEADCPTR